MFLLPGASRQDLSTNKRSGNTYMDLDDLCKHSEENCPKALPHEPPEMVEVFDRLVPQ